MSASPFDELIRQAREQLAAVEQVIDVTAAAVATGGEMQPGWAEMLAENLLRARSRVQALETVRDRWLTGEPTEPTIEEFRAKLFERMDRT